MEYKFNEENIIQQVQRYVDRTYERHYAQGKYQLILLLMQDMEKVFVWVM